MYRNDSKSFYPVSASTVVLVYSQYNQTSNVLLLCGSLLGTPSYPGSTEQSGEHSKKLIRANSSKFDSERRRARTDQTDQTVHFERILENS